MPQRSFPTLDDLINYINRPAGPQSDAARLLAAAIRLLGDRGVDPHLLMGVLLEGAVETLANHLPPEQQADAAKALRTLLNDRLAAHGL